MIRKVLKLIFFFLFSCLSRKMEAQQKYAVIVAINDYYQSPGVKHPRSLSGCINDGKAIRGLLENRFGFSSSNVYTLYNADANRKNLVDLLYMVFHKAKAGDAVVFYFSGHGVWLHNPQLMDDVVKRGMSQAIVMSDLYAPGWECLVRDETLKDIFNQYVDKKIVFTSIFDCCYSGNIVAAPHIEKYWDGWLPVQAQRKDLFIDNITYVVETKEPVGCDSLNRDNTDTDKDGVPDCNDWDIHTPFGEMVDPMGVSYYVPVPDSFALQKDTYYDSLRFIKPPGENAPVLLTKSFNLKDEITINAKSSVRPASKKDGGFLNFSASADNLKALEITGVGGMKHGAFTETLLSVFSRNPSSISVRDLIKKIKASMIQQGYAQQPNFHFDSSRLSGNLIGVSPAGFSNTISTSVISNKNGIIWLNKGFNDGILKGNTMKSTSSGYSIQVMESYGDSAIAKDISKGQIKAGHVFAKTDAYTISQPLMKICIPSMSFTPEYFNKFFNVEVLPLTRDKKWLDYIFDENDLIAGTAMWDAPGFMSLQENGQASGDPSKDHIVYLLPVPSYIASAVKNSLWKNQNIEIVTDPAKADLVLYMNYIKPRPGVKPGFVFYLHPPIETPNAMISRDIFSRKHVLLSTHNPAAKELQSMADKLAAIANGHIRGRTTTWKNEYPRR